MERDSKLDIIFSFYHREDLMTRYWIGVVSKNHVEKAVASSICQLCHGKKHPLTKMSKEDFLIYYSPKISMDGKEPLQKFTAVGKIKTGEIYTFDMGGGFIPYRCDINYYPCEEVSIHELLKDLTFITNPKSWGYPFRFGHFEIPKQDFELIAKAMKVSE